MRHLICLFLILAAVGLMAPIAQAQVGSPLVRVTPTLTASTADCATPAQCSMLGVVGTSNVGVQVKGTWVATLQLEGTMDRDGCLATPTTCTWFAVYGTPVSGGSSVASTTANGAWVVSTPLTYVRVRPSAYTSGTIQINIVGTSAGGGGGGGGGTVTVGNQLQVGGDVASGSAATAPPVTIGCKAQTGGTVTLTAVSNNAVADIPCDADGVPIFRQVSLAGTPSAGDIARGTATLVDTTDTNVITAGGSSINTYLTMVHMCNTSGAAALVDVRDDTTLVATIALGAAPSCYTLDIGANNTPWKPAASNKAWKAKAQAGTATIVVTYSGFRSKL